MTIRRISGVDGCKGGWIEFQFDGTCYATGRLYPNIIDLFNETESDLILIDIPIGLCKNETVERLCDTEARKVLDQRKPCVFPAPSRLALQAGLSYREASEINRNSIGRGLSKQSYGIIPKIKEVDKLIQSPEYQHSSKQIREVHPEICFWGLNNQTEMKYSKKTTLGKCNRLQLLKRYILDIEAVFYETREEYPASQVADDDIIDALICTVTGSFYKNLSTFPNSPERDSEGISMEIVYYDAEKHG